MPQAIRYTILALALAALPGLAAAQTYGDKAQQPSTATTPSQTTTPGTGTETMNKGTSTSAAYQKALSACDQKPADQQQACRDAADAKFSKQQQGMDKSATDKSSSDQPATSAPKAAPSNKQI
jgi:hypothetical protein